MIYHNYKILEINGVDHTKYGKCLMVYANPVTKKSLSFEFSSVVDKRTIKFLFPFKYLQELQRIANTLDYWSPCDSWYIKERIYDDRIKMYGPLYEHVNLNLDRLDMIDSDEDVIPNLNDGEDSFHESLIPNIGYKFRRIIEDWEKEMEKPNTEYGYDKDAGPADMVDWGFYDEKTFFSWLFDDNTISDSSELTDEQAEAYDNFLLELENEGLSSIK